MPETITARDLFKAAYENRYTWDSDFPGYSADLELIQGAEVYHAQVRINADLTVEVSGIDHEEVQQSIYTQLRDIVTHRKRSTFDAAHGKNSFNLGHTDETGAMEILVTGDAMGSNYKIRGTEICQVSRVMGRMAFVIDTRDSLDTGNGYVSTRYDVIFTNPQSGERVQELKFEDTYTPLGNYYVMTHQVIHTNKQGQETTTEFKYSNLKLLEMAIAP